jgi:copper chaperone CopZ
MNRFAAFLYLACFALLLFIGCQAPQQISFFTEGNCMECEALITAALASTPGVKEAQWDMETSLTTVRYNPGKTDPDQIQEAVAEAGFVTQLFPPNEENRATLPACCRQQINRQLKQNQANPHE